MLREVEPGSYVVLDEGGERSIVELGALLGIGPKRKGKREVHGAIVHDLDDQSFRVVAPRQARSVSPDTEVTFVIASARWLRSLRNIGARVRQSVGGSVRDPLQSGSEAEAL